MKLTSNESTFLEIIKKTCIDECVKNTITPSVIGSLAIVISNWGTSKEFFNTRNVFLMPVNHKWFGKCYSKKSEKIYDKVDNCDEIGVILYRVYNTYQESIKDFISELMTTRRSENGPFRYSSIIGCTDYKETINKLDRSEFIKNYLFRNDNIEYTNNLITIIERYELYKWDSILKEELELSKKKIRQQQQKEVVEQATTSMEQIEHIYRVRLDWDKRDTQIFASPSYDLALEMALKHEGYKIYIDDDGVLFENPWLKPEEPVEEDKGPKPLIHAIKGHIVVLKNTPVYRGALDRFPMAYMSGEFYFYDNTIVNNRGKITVHKNIKKPDPSLILGYIHVDA